MGFNIGFIVIAGFNVAACSILGIVYAWKLGMVIVFAGLPALVGCGWIKMQFDGRLDRIVAKRLATSSAIASESTTAIRTVSSLGIESSILSRYSYELDHAIKNSLTPLLNVMMWFSLTQASEYWFMALGFWYVSFTLSCASIFLTYSHRYGSRLVSFGEITLFEFFVSYMSVFFCAQATSQIFNFSTSKIEYIAIP
jgi:ATP-binding cassette subfamily B (MDR/TAP) protein 1